MATKSSKVFVSGKVYWAKIVGDKALVQNYDGDGREWSVEFEPDDVSFLKEHRLLDRLKDPMAYARRLQERGETEKAEKAEKDAEGRGDYLLLRKSEFNRDGEKNEPFRIYDADNNDWDDRLIGNGSSVDVKLDIRDWGVGKKKSIYATAIRVTDLVSYESDPFAGMDKGKSPTEKPSKAAEKKAKPAPKTILEELDEDELPF
jgi:hypothetical protein